MEIPILHGNNFQPDGSAGLLDGTTILRGFAGAVCPLLAIMTSFQAELEWWLRVGALISGICVSLLSIISLIRNMKK